MCEVPSGYGPEVRTPPTRPQHHSKRRVYTLHSTTTNGHETQVRDARRHARCYYTTTTRRNSGFVWAINTVTSIPISLTRTDKAFWRRSEHDFIDDARPTTHACSKKTACTRVRVERGRRQPPTPAFALSAANYRRMQRESNDLHNIAYSSWTPLCLASSCTFFVRGLFTVGLREGDCKQLAQVQCSSHSSLIETAPR